MLLGAFQRLVDLVVGDFSGLRGLPPYQLCPDDPGGQLVDERRAVDAARLKHLVQLARFHVVLFFDLLQPVIDLSVGGGDVLLLGFLQLELLVDQRVQNLASDALAHLRRVGNVRRDHHHAHPRHEVEHRDDLVVDDSGDVHLRRSGGRLSGSPPRWRRDRGLASVQLRRIGGAGAQSQSKDRRAQRTKHRH